MLNNVTSTVGISAEHILGPITAVRYHARQIAYSNG